MTTHWSTLRRGEATVTYGKPYYGKPRIIANAPLTLTSFDHLIEALQTARDHYKDQAENPTDTP